MWLRFLSWIHCRHGCLLCGNFVTISCWHIAVHRFSLPFVMRELSTSPFPCAPPRLLAADRGYPAGAANRGRFLLVTFLGKTRKVTSRRATPGGVDLFPA